MKQTLNLRRLGLLLALVLGSACFASAQDAPGRVAAQVAAAGVPLDGAKVVATNEQTKQSTTMITNVSGRCTIDNLAPGLYAIEFSAHGFITKQRSVRVKPGKKATVHASLKSTAAAKPAPQHSSDKGAPDS